MDHFTAILFSLAAQDEAASSMPLPPVDAPLWPYIVAIGSLSTVVVTLFGLLMKSNGKHTVLQESHALVVAALNKEHVTAMEEKAKRGNEEVEKKDKVIVEALTKFATLMERVAQELAQLNDSNRRK
jgi:hypothetical protein